MAATGESVEVDVRHIGLDRADITQQGQIQLPDHGPQDDIAHMKSEPESRSSTHRVVNSLKQKKHDAGVKVRKTLHIKKPSDDLASSTSPILANAADEKSDSRLDGASTTPEKHTLKDFTHNPVETVKSKISDKGNQQVAANIAAKEIPHGQDVDLVNASSAVERARSEHERMLAVQNLNDLLKLRQSTYVRWTLDRHVTSIRVLPRETVTRRPKADFETKNARGEVVVDWRAYGTHLVEYYAQRYGGQYIGYGSQPPAPSKETIMPNIERLIVATSPFQEFVMTTRRVYRWEHPAETAKYLVIYLVLWYLNLILPGVMAAIMYLVVERRINGVTMEALREDIKHTEDIHRTALSLNEFIEKKGDEHWADEILQDLGPWLMVQLSDLANFFESVLNFYEWRKPYRTGTALGVLGMAMLVTALIPQWLLIKSVSFSLGFTFFAVWPIAVNFPEYRLLVSPTKRFLWNIPTHGEWAIKYIQAQGSRVEATAIPASPLLVATADSQPPKADDYGFYVAHHNHMPGHLVISTSSIRFVSKHPHSVHFTLDYDQIQSIDKQNRVVKQNVPDKLSRDSGKDLKLVDKLGRETLLKNVDRRDEAFSQIVGFSKTTWQIVW